MTGLGRRWWRAVTVAVAVAMTAPAPAGATESSDVTGDVTAPEVRSFTVTPSSADTTTDDAHFSVTLRITDDRSGVFQPQLHWLSNGGSHATGVGLLLTSGDELDGTWTGQFTIGQGTPPGRYPFHLSVNDRVHNGSSFDAAALAERGLASGVDLTNSAPDDEPPIVTRVVVAPASVDVREAPARVDVELSVEDAGLGVEGVVVFLLGPEGGGGVDSPFMSLSSGDRRSGTWRGSTTVPQHVRSGRWDLEVRVSDAVGNVTQLDAAALAAAGLTSGLDVASDPDVEAPRFVSAEVSPTALDVHSEDQEVRIRVRVTDDRTGVRPFRYSSYHEVQAHVSNPAVGQGQGVSAMLRTSGDAFDGVYEAAVTIPRSSATGVWQVSISAADAVGNRREIRGSELAAIGASPTVLVFNVPLPPVDVVAAPGDGHAIIRWAAPEDDHGSPISGYVVRAEPGGWVIRVPGDARSATVLGLDNGVEYSFTVSAVNDAGSSAPSASATATPTAEPAASDLVAAACPGQVPEDGFVDVEPSNAHETAVDCAAAWGLVRGIQPDRFGPAVHVTRGQLASIVVSLLDAIGRPLPHGGPSGFSDVEGSVHAASIEDLTAAGIIVGYPDGTFRPAAAVSRAALATILARVLEHAAGTLPPGPDRFADDDGSVHEPAIRALGGLGIISGTSDGRFLPHDLVRRDQAASFLARSIGWLVQNDHAQVSST